MLKKYPYLKSKFQGVDENCGDINADCRQWISSK